MVKKLLLTGGHHIKEHKKLAILITTIAVILIIIGVGLYLLIPRTVYVDINDSLTVMSKTYETRDKSIESFLMDNHIEYSSNDKVEPALDTKIEDDTKIIITKAFEVDITADGKTQKQTVLPKRVSEILRENNIQISNVDIVTPKLNEVIKKGDKIIVKRVTTKEGTKIKAIGHQTIYNSNSQITIGKVVVLKNGKDGKKNVRYLDKYIDGKKIGREIIDTNIIEESKDRVVSYGTKISFETPEGLNYTQKITDVKAVAYHFSGTPVGAYGGRCQYGTVAVDTDLIPLGSRLYIEGYGYAIANDVGTGIKGKVVDLYMEEYEQCLIWGARWTTIYVLE